MGLFWPNLQSSISDKSFFNNDRYISRYNFSWNLGVLIGFSTGAIILYYVEEVKIIFYIGPILIFINFLLSAVFFQESNNNKLKSLSIEKLAKRSDIDSNHRYIPIILPFILVIAFSIAKSSVNLLYPIKSEIIGFEAYTVYLLAFYGIITQLLATTIASYLNNGSIRKISIICMASLILVCTFYGINYSFFIFILLYFLLGFFSGLLYSFGLKMILLLNVKNNTSKYSSMYESTIGLTFLIIPITSGYIAVSDLNLAFYIISIEIFFVLVASILFFRKFQI
jgi:MFS family permease